MAASFTKPSGVCAGWEKGSTGEGKFYYIHPDNLGSWQALTDQNGTMIKRYSYDAWGRPRSGELYPPNLWIDCLPPAPPGVKL